MLDDYDKDQFTVNSYPVCGFGDAEPNPIDLKVKAELKNGFILHAKGFFEDNVFHANGAVIDNHVGDGVN